MNKRVPPISILRQLKISCISLEISGCRYLQKGTRMYQTKSLKIIMVKNAREKGKRLVQNN
jgi:hypothetical protein